MTAGPLAGIRVVVTRAQHQADGLVEALETVSADVARLPLLEVVEPRDMRPLHRAASELALYDWLIFTSANAVEAFLPRAEGPLPPRLRVAVVGGRTARATRQYGVEPDLVATPSRAEGLLEALGPRLGRRQRLLLPQAADAAPTLVDGLHAAGGEPVPVVAYAKRCPAQAGAQALELFRGRPIGWVTFTSPSTVRHFVALFEDWEERRHELQAASIGPVTSQALRHAGIDPATEATNPSDEELAQAVVSAQ